MKLLAVIAAFFLALWGLLFLLLEVATAPLATKDGLGQFAALEQTFQTQGPPPGTEDMRGYWCDGQGNVIRVTAVCQLDGETVVLYRPVFCDHDRPHQAGKFCLLTYVADRFSQGDISCLPHATWQELARQGHLVRTTRASLWRVRAPGDSSVDEDFRQDIIAVGRLENVEVRDVFRHGAAVFVLAEGTDEDKERLQNNLKLYGHYPFVVP